MDWSWNANGCAHWQITSLLGCYFKQKSCWQKQMWCCRGRRSRTCNAFGEGGTVSKTCDAAGGPECISVFHIINLILEKGGRNHTKTVLVHQSSLSAQVGNCNFWLVARGSIKERQERGLCKKPSFIIICLSHGRSKSEYIYWWSSFRLRAGSIPGELQAAPLSGKGHALHVENPTCNLQEQQLSGSDVFLL